MNQELHNEYWRKRCELAERCLETSPCDPDITPAQIEAHEAYDSFINSPTDTALYTGFIILLQENGMWYEYENDGQWHKLNFWYNGTNFKQEGVNITAPTVYRAFEMAVEELKRLSI